MPRIRSLKPEHKQHRKVGMLSDFQYRLWVGMITEADDAGRLVADSAQLRALIFPFRRDVTLDEVDVALVHLDSTRLVRVFFVGRTRFVEFPSWLDHQRIQRPSPSKLPSYKDSRRGKFTERSRNDPGSFAGDRKGSDLIKEGSGSEEEGSVRGGGETPPLLGGAASPNKAGSHSNGQLRRPAPGEYERTVETLKAQHPEWTTEQLEREALARYNASLKL